MRVRRLDHVLLAMPPGREADARRFYQDILGIPEAKKPADLAARGGCCLRMAK
jgi:catechol 2,3-dioxygenase-like lactoylglutathione lyase family enzyme